MEHLTLKAVATTTDQGVFEAVISTESIDREKDIVSADGMVAALRKWNRPIPLAWNHSAAAEDIFGHMDPQTVKNVGGEVVASGQVDLESKVGKEAWRSFKSRAIGFSFGYLILKSTNRKGGGRAISELDVFEVTATPTPMNNDTRVLSTKAATDQPPSPTQMRILMSMIGQAQEYIAGEPEAEDATEMAEILDTLQELRGEPGSGEDEPEAPEKSADALRKQAARVALEVEATSLPEVPEIEPEPKVDLVKELQEVKARLAASEKALEDLSKKAEVADKEPRARSADPLRQQAEAVALEVASGGRSLLRPPKTVEAKRTEPSIPLDELKQRCRDEMLGVLSGGLNE